MFIEKSVGVLGQSLSVGWILEDRDTMGGKVRTFVGDQNAIGVLY